MLGKKNESRFSLQFDDENPKHFNAICVLNEKTRNKANYIAELIWEKEYESKSEEKTTDATIRNKDELKKIIKECLIEVISENKEMFSFTSTSKENNAEEKIKENEDVLILGQDSKNALKYNKEVLSGLSCFGIKK